jgi:hypothetical protein
MEEYRIIDSRLKIEDASVIQALNNAGWNPTKDGDTGTFYLDPSTARSQQDVRALERQTFDIVKLILEYTYMDEGERQVRWVHYRDNTETSFRKTYTEPGTWNLD